MASLECDLRRGQSRGGGGASVNTKLSYAAAPVLHFDFNLAVARCRRGDAPSCNLLTLTR